ncbi:hypothetical protein VMCG_03333 [Cytospora schulzeri]|uniref:DUF7820 domain-containing protein n=1 Tax=Cytospora schulzeri TaxID=448051 RepID=A0A423WY42_9PEZI|nr:hypothetical protein VMCG_03333 [Valsa malicola]
MDPTDGKATDPERRASVRTSRRISTQQDGGFDDDDDYALLALGISDGFRPQSLDTGDRSSVPQPLVARPDSQASTSSPPRLNRSSISKPPRGRDSLTLRHDGAMGHISGPSHSRVSSTSTQSPYIPSETPYQGPSAPSHPYQMYSQNPRLARTTSVTTTSSTPTTRPESEYNGPRGPAHPYSMYPQNPFTDTSSEVAAPSIPTIPVGFVNNTDPYQRRLGPEGEELADIIGPDGHTEELPPYTRYPDEYYNRKIRDNQDAQPEGSAAAGASTAAAAAAVVPAVAAEPAEPAAVAESAVPADTSTPAAANPPVTMTRAIPGAGGIGLAARDPEFDAASEAGAPQSRDSTRSSTNESHHEVNTAAAPMSEKPQFNKFQRFAKRKACGVIPYWAICLTVTAIVIVIIIVGAVIGTLLSHHKDSQDNKPRPTSYQDSVPTITITYDAVPISTPTDLPALPTGIYSLPLNLDKSPNTCFTDTAQTSAWSCNIIWDEEVEMQMSISRNAPQLGDQSNYDIILITNTSLGVGDNAVTYGTQPPVLEPAMSMELVNDTSDLDRGPAWFRMLPYNKTVVVPEDLLAGATLSSVRRNSGTYIPRSGDLQSRSLTAQPGDKPWICYWPGTFVEVFIYAQQNSSYAGQTSASTGVITSAPTATPTATDSDATQTSTQNVGDYMPLASYPRAVKVKERRDHQSQPPYCVQVTVNPDNSTSPVMGTNGQPVMMYIDEEEPGPAPPDSGDSSWANSDRRRRRYRRDASEQWLTPRDDHDDMSACGCMWFAS